jgi:D-hydroxyproline dehydrogenase subunit beta
MSAVPYDVMVIGAGIVGAACADAFARKGLRVGVVERDVIGSGATAAGMGHLVVMDDSEAQFALTRYSQRLWQQLAPELPAEVEYQQCGTIWVGADEQELAEATCKQRYYCDRGVPATVIDAETLRQLEPNLRPGLSGGLLIPEDAVIYPPRAALFLLERAQARGAQLVFGSVQDIGKGSVRLGDGSRLSAGLIVNAAGAWAPLLSPRLDIRMRKGHLVITDRYPGFARHQLVELGYLKSAHSLITDSVAFNIQPRQTGQMLIGSSRQYGAESTRVDSAILSRMLQRALDFMPALAQTTAIRAWTGFRAATPDKLPIIGQSPEDASVYFATGHEGLGITTALGTAQLLLDQIMGNRPEIPLAPYLPTRVFAEHTHA